MTTAKGVPVITEARSESGQGFRITQDDHYPEIHFVEESADRFLIVKVSDLRALRTAITRHLVALGVEPSPEAGTEDAPWE